MLVFVGSKLANSAKTWTEYGSVHPVAVDTFLSASVVNAIIETPKGSRVKYKYDETLGLFKLDKVLTAGTVFPLDYGFIPSTRGADGDPLDVLVLIEEPVSVGCLLSVRLIGVIEADQTESRKTKRNNRPFGVAFESHVHRKTASLRDISSKLLAEIEYFFVFYNHAQGRKFSVRGRHGAPRALKLIREGQALFESDRKLRARADHKPSHPAP
jgi:inorganic pyrophosphatase